MSKADQTMRNNALDNDAPWDDSLDKLHTKRLKKIVERYGWPTVSLVGSEASHNAWLLVQHANHDVLFQEQCLSLMKALPEGEIRLDNIAYLEDRILTSKGKLQLYGTQFQGTGKELMPQPIKDKKNLDSRREKMELGSFDDYMRIMVETFGEQQPQD